MDIIEPILAIAEKLYSLCEEVKANKKRCRRLGHRVSTLAGLVRAVKVHGFGTEPEQVRKGLENLKLTLESAEMVVKKYTSFSYLRRVAKAYDLGEEFSFLNERLNDAAQVLSLALQVEHRASIEKVFQEATRRREDEEDRQSDSLELRELLQSLAQESKGTNMMVDAVQKTVDQTHALVFLCLWLAVKKPRPHLQDIREIKLEELTYSLPTKPLIKCSHSELYKGTYNKFTVAIKRYAYPLCTSPSELRSVFNKEVETMKRFESPNILRMFGICVEDENGPNPSFLIVMEYCEKGSLRQVLDSNCNLPWERKTQMCLDAAQAYRLHQSEEKFKVHGSIRSCSFLVAAGYRVKLGGFELAKTETSLQKNKSKRSSAFHYNSPQQLQNINHPYDKACEIYSFGIVLWEIATRDVPFKDCTSPSQIFQKVCIEKVMEPLPKDCPKKLKELINACRSFEPFLRPTLLFIVNVNALTKVN
uniref:Protein kinase domain-containing protein n=1 Tax=Cyprinus carpio TaxID=7962 RepID=A0A8C1YC21_CYPCA